MKHLLFLLLCTALMACETTVEIDIPRNTTQLTANALFNPDSVWKVELTQNRYVLDTTRFAPVPDATVRIRQQGRVVAELDYQGESIYYRNSLYTSKDDRPELGEDYTLEVSHPTLGSVTANSRTTPVPTPILSFVWDTLDIREIPNSTSDRVAYGVTIRLDDPPEENFYSLIIATRTEFIVGRDIDNDGILDPVLREFASSEAGMRSDDPVVDNPSDDYVSELLFKDVNFNGQAYELKLYMQQTSGIQNATYPSLFARDFYDLGENVYNPDGKIIYKPGDTFPTNFMYALLRTTTEEYYQHNYTRKLQSFVRSNPFAQPVQVFDNIDNGLGIFAGYSQMKKDVTFK